jgi:hypothetical protein
VRAEIGDHCAFVGIVVAGGTSAGAGTKAAWTGAGLAEKTVFRDFMVTLARWKTCYSTIIVTE